MKTIAVPASKMLAAAFVAAIMMVSSKTYSQTIPELIFKNPVLVSGTSGQDGAQYRFNNVAQGLDAIVEIKGRSSANVVISNIDSTGIGWDKALQPVVGIPGTVPANQNWWAKFRLTFYQAGTNTKQTITKFFLTGLDIDGDGQSLQEWVQMDKITKVSFSSINNLTDNLLGVVTDLLNLDNNGEDHKIVGPVANYTNIDTSATSVMATYQYDQKDNIEFYLGGKTNNGSTTAGMRMNSLWFKQFNLAPVTLPVKLTDFTAKYNSTSVTLNWKTSQEISFSHYEIEHSSDGNSFSTTAIVFGSADPGMGAEYSYIDRTVNDRGGIIYYRLKMVDIDGRFTYSPVRVIRLGDQKQTIALSTYPNPVVSDVRVTLPTAWQGKPVSIDIFNANGQNIKSLRIANSSQTETVSMKEIGHGAYFVSAACGTETARQTIIKN